MRLDAIQTTFHVQKKYFGVNIMEFWEIKCKKTNDVDVWNASGQKPERSNKELRLVVASLCAHLWLNSAF